MAFSLSVPATLSNLGPGFDVLGLAVGMANTFVIEVAPAGVFEADGVPVGADEHLVFSTAQRAGERFGVPLETGLTLVQQERLPRGRGLGSSATARVAGLAAWSYATGLKPTLQQALDFLTEEEGHPDNAVAALLGGITIAVQVEGRVQAVSVPVPAGWFVALVIPEVEISTDAARKVLPASYSRQDVVFNSARLALLVHGLITGQTAGLPEATRDRVHHPYRAPLIGPVDEAIEAALAAGAAAAFISGSGSTLAALVCSELVDPAEVALALTKPFHAVGIGARAVTLAPAVSGAWAQIIGR
jgi:homoserine kinase